MFRAIVIALGIWPLAASRLEGQTNPYVPQQQNDPRVRRAWREQAVAYAGPGSRSFIETMGEPAVAAIAACSRNGARKLVEFHASGSLGKLPRPSDLLWVIGQPRHGDDVALWAIDHSKELTDIDQFNAFIASPLEYTLKLKPLETGGAECRAQRLQAQAAATPVQPVRVQAVPVQNVIGVDGRLLVFVFGVAGIVALLIWKQRQGLT